MADDTDTYEKVSENTDPSIKDVLAQQDINASDVDSRERGELQQELADQTQEQPDDDTAETIEPIGLS